MTPSSNYDPRLKKPASGSPTRPGKSAPGAPRATAQGQSWHWQRPDALGGIHGWYPLKLLFQDHVGLDIGSQWIKYAVTRHGAGRQRLLAAGSVPLRAESHGEMGKIRAQVGAMLAIREQIARGSQRWTVGISGPGTMVRTVEVPRMPRKELRRAIIWQAQKKIPFPLDEAHVAIQYHRTASSQPVRAVVAAAIRRIVDDLLYLLTEAEIRPAAITLPAFALGRLLTRADHERAGGYRGVLDIGAERSLFAVYRGEILEFFREIDLGVGDVEETLARNAQLGHHSDPSEATQAANLLFGRGLLLQDEHTPSEVGSRAVGSALEMLLLEIQSTLEYYAAQSGGLRITGFSLLGGGAEIPGIADHLSNFLELPVQTLHPLDDGTVTPFEGPDMAPPTNWASAYGYSLLPRSAPNLLPAEYVREQEAALRSMLWRTATGTAVAVSLIVAGAETYRGEFAARRLQNLEAQLSESQHKLAELGVRNMEASLASNRRWLETVRRDDVQVAAILRVIAARTTSAIALDRVDIRPHDSGWADVSLSGEVRTAHHQNEVVLARFVERLREVSWFRDVHLESYGATRRPEYEQLTYQIHLRTPLGVTAP